MQNLQKRVEFNPENEEYIYRGIQKLVEQGNMGYLSAFYNSQINTEGVFFTLDSFKAIFDEFDIIAKWETFPKEFVLTIKFSPINLFKRWIYIISTKGFYKINEQSKGIEKEYFLYNLENQLFFFSITTNITHERFLLMCYTKEEIKESNLTFTTYLSDKKKLVIYKDYKRKKVSVINFPRNFSEGRPYKFKVSVIKSGDRIRFKVYVEGNNFQTIHSLKIGNSSGTLVSSSDSKKEDKVSQSSINKYRRKVFEILAKNDKLEMETNKFANVSLGRVNKIPVLINLSKNYADQKIKVQFKEKEEIFLIYLKKELIKTFSVSFSPKSNWLERA